MENVVKRIAFFNPQGNFDKNDSHLTEHPDFGGQLVYVKELAKAMSFKGIEVDIFTRQIIDENWPEFSEPLDYYPDAPNVRIVRIPFGGEKFVRKEDLWPYIPEYVEKIYKFYKSEGVFPNFVTTHYSDGGMSGVLFCEKTGIPFSFTAHSLGVWKLEKLLKNGLDRKELEKKYRFSVRIFAENLSIKYSSFVVCSTNQERYEQYSHELYKVDPYNEKFKVIPPGINHRIFNTQKQNIDELIEKYLSEVISRTSLKRQKLPFIIMSSRIDRKKNHISVVRAFLGNEKLKNIANLLIVLRGIDDVVNFTKSSTTEEANILREIVGTANDEIGKSIFFINISDQRSLAALYRVAAQRGSVFALPALYEPFGLAIVEAAACGLKIVATMNGGPAEILSNQEGLLINPEDSEDIASKLTIAVTKFDAKKSLELASKYSWEKTAERYLEYINKSLDNNEPCSVDKSDISKFIKMIDELQ
ncbi:MAG: glycosyltransferase [Fervidobacterium sp.]